MAPFEFSVYRDYAFAGIPWDFVTVVGAEVDGLARGLGLLVLDPQSKSVALPDALGGRPLEWAAAEEGREQFHDIVGQMGDAIGTTLDPVEGMQRFHEQMAAQGFRISSPAGFDITPGMEAELFADPTRTPTSLQTPEARDRLLRDARSKRRGARQRALMQLNGWDPDPAVAALLRELLDSDDAWDRYIAATGAARQRDVGALDAVVAVLEREAGREERRRPHDRLLPSGAAASDLAVVSAGPDSGPARPGEAQTALRADAPAARITRTSSWKSSSPMRRVGAAVPGAVS